MEVAPGGGKLFPYYQPNVGVRGGRQSYIACRKLGTGGASGRAPGVDLSPLKKEDRLVPVITLVLYMGEDPWNAAKRLHDLLDFSEIPHELRDYVPDYA